jgi:Ca-activated chloride channel family protein
MHQEQTLNQTSWKMELSLTVGLLLAWGLCADSPRKAAEYMGRGQYGDAMRVYADLASKKPDDARYLYNAGVAAYKALEYQEAQEFFDAASLSSDLNLQQQSFYNRGNALFKAGENEAQFEKKTQLWKEAIDQFDHAVKLDENDKLANDNLKFVKQQLENLQQQEQEQNQDNQPNEDQNEDSEQDNQQQNDQNQSQENQQDQDQQQQQENQQDPGKDQNQDQSSQQDQQDQKNGEQDQEDSKQEEEQKQNQSSESGEDQNEEESSANQPEEGEGAEQEMPLTTMTPQQAMQLLESEKDEAKALIFKPRENQRSKRFKDW